MNLTITPNNIIVISPLIIVVVVLVVYIVKHAKHNIRANGLIPIKSLRSKDNKFKIDLLCNERAISDQCRISIRAFIGNETSDSIAITANDYELLMNKISREQLVEMFKRTANNPVGISKLDECMSYYFYEELFRLQYAS